MLTCEQQTWEYLQYRYPEIFRLGQQRLREATANNTLNVVTTVGVNQFTWSHTPEGDEFWRVLYYCGIYELSSTNFFKLFNLI